MNHRGTKKEEKEATFYNRQLELQVSREGGQLTESRRETRGTRWKHRQEPYTSIRGENINKINMINISMLNVPLR